jgi:hypothetical protein
LRAIENRVLRRMFVPKSEEVIGGWKNNVRKVRREIGWKAVGWMRLHQYRDQWWALVKTAVNLRVP